jgi:hypothetical protein
MTLLFGEASVAEATHPLLRRLRHVLCKRRLTQEDFRALIRAYDRRTRDMGNSGQGGEREDMRVNTRYDELMHEIQQPQHMTYLHFEFILRELLQMTDDDVELVLQDDVTNTTVRIDRTLLKTLIDNTRAYRDMLSNSCSGDDTKLQQSSRAVAAANRLFTSG